MTPPLNRLIQSSFQKHPFVTIGIIVVVCLVPFANKAVQTDDALFIWTGQWIQKHPVDFFGCTVNWWGSTDPMWAANWNPPLMSYLLAGTASLFGWHEIFLHLACILVAIAAAAGTYALSKMWCERPLLAAVIVIFTPAFLVSGTTLMCDMLMLSFWIWALVFYERALGTESSRWQFIVAGVFVSLAILTKYSAVILMPLMLFGGAFRMRKLGWWLLWLVVPTSIMACYEGLTIRLYGHGLLSMAGHYAQSFRFGYPGGWMAKGIISLAFLGGSLLPALFFTPWLWRWQTWTSIGTVILSALFGTFWLGGDPGLIHPWIDPGAWQNLGFRLQVALLTTAGLHLFLIAGTEALQRKDRISMLLAFWIISVFLFACVLNWTISARSLLPAAPAAAILIVRRLEIMKKSFRSLGWLAAPMSLTMAVTLCLAVADFKEANLVRSVAEQIFTKYRSPNHKLWIEGHGGFQYYLQALGAQPIDNKQSVLQPEDVVAVSWSSGGFVVLPPGSLGLVSMLSPKSHAWMNLSGGNRFGLAGFYDADWGPIPFTIGESDHGYLIAKMFTEVSCFSGPESAPSQAAGHFGKHPGTMDKNPVSPDISKAAEQIQLARQFQIKGENETAIECYNKALDLDADNVEALNGLAWILSTADNPAMRNGNKAVDLAMKAAKLSKWRQPTVIETLSVAYANADQYSNALIMAQAANELAILTGRSDIAARTAKLQNFYRIRAAARPVGQ